jgi:hypothetical protein
MTHANHLVDETSPYLLQHANNPVDWYPWGTEGLEKARREDKPIFLSVGYSTCHWCHVMAHESFEDSDVADILNAHFVAIKVDREERPDIDHVYMQVTSALTGHGGWPNTVLLTPDRKAFHAATYLPKSYLVDLLRQAADLWASRGPDLVREADSIAEQLAQHVGLPAPGSVTIDDIVEGAQMLMRSYDWHNPGFGSQPKFPTPHNLIFLLRTWWATGDNNYRQAALESLRAIRRGGIYDQLGFGLHRYSTDAEWHVPHFEKMLYDQAMLASAAAEAFRATSDPFFSEMAEEVLTYVDRDLSDPAGGFWSAQDADSEGHEGRFYVWSEDELREILGEDDFRYLKHAYMTEPVGRQDGQNVPRMASDVEIGDKRLAALRERLLAVRNARIHPITDDKVLTDWNGLMISAFAQTGAATGQRRWIERAAKAADFVLQILRDGRRLAHQNRAGKTQGEAFLDDYAFLIGGLIDLYEAGFEPKYLIDAAALADVMLADFGDGDGGLFMSRAGDEYVAERPRQPEDGPIPSGAAVAAYNLARLGRLLGSTELETAALGILNSVGERVQQHPGSSIGFLLAADFLLRPGYEIVVVQAQDDPLPRIPYAPQAVVLVKRGAELDALAPFTREMAPLDGQLTAYLCHGHACELPTTDLDSVFRAIAGSNSARL